MTTEIHLDRNQVPGQLRGGYSGKQFTVTVTDSVTIPADAGLWSEGSRDTFTAIRVSDGATVPFPGQQAAPWDNRRADRKVTLTPGFAVVEHSISRGRDMGLRFYLHPADAAPMLPAPVELTPVERLVLEYTVTRKSSYNGMDRFTMAVHDLKAGYRSRDGIERLDREIWDAAKQSLITRGMLNKAGAVTTLGRNAHQLAAAGA